MSEFTPEFIREQRELAEKATKGEYAESEYDGSICAFGDGQGIVIGEIDREVDSYYFCTAANNYPAALERIQALETNVQRFAAQLVAWGFDDAAKELITEVLGPDGVISPNIKALEAENANLIICLKRIREDLEEDLSGNVTNPFIKLTTVQTIREVLEDGGGFPIVPPAPRCSRQKIRINKHV